jgi:hypothetical protein
VKRNPGQTSTPIPDFASLHPGYTFASLLRRRGLACGDGDRAVSRSNILYFVVGALVIVVAVMGYQLYQDRKKPPEGVRIDVGPNGLSIEKK